MNNCLFCLASVGSSKRRKKEELLGKPFRRPQHELDSNGLVPLPVKVCFSCGRFVFKLNCTVVYREYFHWPDKNLIIFSPLWCIIVSPDSWQCTALLGWDLCGIPLWILCSLCLLVTRKPTRCIPPPNVTTSVYVRKCTRVWNNIANVNTERRASGGGGWHHTEARYEAVVPNVNVCFPLAGVAGWHRLSSVTIVPSCSIWTVWILHSPPCCAESGCAQITLST